MSSCVPSFTCCEENFRESVCKRQELGIAAPFETAEGYLFAADLNMPRRFESLAELLLAAGHSERRVEKVLGPGDSANCRRNNKSMLHQSDMLYPLLEASAGR